MPIISTSNAARPMPINVAACRRVTPAALPLFGHVHRPCQVGEFVACQSDRDTAFPLHLRQGVGILENEDPVDAIRACGLVGNHFHQAGRVQIEALHDVVQCEGPCRVFFQLGALARFGKDMHNAQYLFSRAYLNLKLVDTLLGFGIEIYKADAPARLSQIPSQQRRVCGFSGFLEDISMVVTPLERGRGQRRPFLDGVALILEGLAGSGDRFGARLREAGDFASGSDREEPRRGTEGAQHKDNRTSDRQVSPRWFFSRLEKSVRGAGGQWYRPGVREVSRHGCMPSRARCFARAPCAAHSERSRAAADRPG